VKVHDVGTERRGRPSECADSEQIAVAAYGDAAHADTCGLGALEQVIVRSRDEQDLVASRGESAAQEERLPLSPAPAFRGIHMEHSKQ
jgi:hypothetical protein